MTTAPAWRIPGTDLGRPFADLMHSGLLWLINTTALHPRGFALALVLRGDEVTGWNLIGDGTEPWVFLDADAKWRFGDVEATFAAARRPKAPAASSHGRIVIRRERPQYWGYWCSAGSAFSGARDFAEICHRARIHWEDRHLTGQHS